MLAKKNLSDFREKGELLLKKKQKKTETQAEAEIRFRFKAIFRGTPICHKRLNARS